MQQNTEQLYSSTMQNAYFVTYLVEIRAGSEGKDHDSNRKIRKNIHGFDRCSVSDPNVLLQVRCSHNMVKCSLLKMA